MSSQSDPKTFSIRIVSMDYYMAPPIPDFDICYSTFQGGSVAEVPVIRIYGSTLAGQKTCLHVHRALPYLYVPCSDVSIRTPQEGHTYTQLISCAMEKALKLKAFDGSKKQHVHGCTLVRARKFYGFHSSEELFVKIYLYYPHEVVRAANLLLGGSVLNRTFQPCESHFPYLLQFLVDYNLYGMGLIHLSKVKFRHPLPVDFIPRAVRYSRHCIYETHKPSCASTSFQADSISEACQDPAVWLSSTIPCGWMWPFPAIGPDYSQEQGVLFKRQSTCELEGDSTVDEILNQQFKLYTPLSQIGSDVKMVQSLVPIWEEEYERSGVHDAAKSPDPSRPPPEYVLRTFSHGIGFEDAFLDLCVEAHNSPPQATPQEDCDNFVKSIRSLSDVSDFHKLEAHVNSSIFHGESSKCQNVENKNDPTLAQVPFPMAGDDMTSLEHRDGFHGPVPIIEETLSSGTIEVSNTKGVDSDALGLLRWLASSQAMEDLNTDDELVHEAILSPLLPTTNIEKALERAHLEFESESQQECQDILDSVVGKEEPTCFPDREPSVRISENVIPQVDGSCDDLFISHRDNSSEMEMNNDVEKPTLYARVLDTGAGLNKQKRNQPLWGSLPFSAIKKVNDDSGSANISSTEISSSEVKSDIGSYTSAGNEVEKSYNELVINRPHTVTGSSGLNEGKILSECSVRDLMRRKRCNRVESSECESHRIKKMVYPKGQKEEMCPSPEDLAFQNVEHDIILHGTSHVKSSPSDLCRTGKERKPGAITSCLGACSDGSRPRSTSYDTLRHGKLPFRSSVGCSLRASVSSDEHFGSKGWRDGENIGASVESERFAITCMSQLYDEPVGIPDTFNSDQPDTIRCTTVGEHHTVESDWSTFKLATSDGYKQKPNLEVTGRLLKFDDDGEDNQPVDGGLEKMEIVPHSCLTTIPAEDASLVEDICIDNHDNAGSVAVGGVLQIEKHEKTSASVDADVLQIEKCTSGREDIMQTFSSGLDLATVINKEKYPMEYIELTFTKKPPIDLTDWISMDTSSIPAVYGNGFLEIGDCLDGRPGSDGDGLPAFRANDSGDGNESRQISVKSSGSHDHGQEPVLGVPTHYQNDGSFLYLLTPALFPPSLEHVRQWILQLAEKSGMDVPIGTPRENLHEALMRPSSPKYSNVLGLPRKANNHCSDGRSPKEQQNVHEVSSSYLNYPQGFFGDVCDEFLSGPDTVPNAKHDMDQSIHKKNGNLKIEINLCRTNRMSKKTEPQNDGKNVKEREFAENWHELSQISGADMKSNLTPLSQTGFRDPASVGAGQQLTLLSIEVQAESRGDLRPDPRFDAINIIALAFQEDNDHVREVYLLLRSNDEKFCQRNLDEIFGCKVVSTSEEKLLFEHFMKIISSFDPDILMGWEIQGGSLGFLAERAAHLGIGLLRNISRTHLFETKAGTNDSTNPEKGIPDHVLMDALVSDSVVCEDAIIEDEWGRTHTSGVHVGGRIVLNIWRIMRSEIKLNMYTVEAVAEAVLRRKIPSFPCRVLTQWFSSGPARARFLCIEHVIERAKLNLEIMNQLDLINRTSELARVFGIDFFSVLSRGSQYRVESMFLRLAHSQNYLALSPGSQKVASQPAMECLPLVMEPESGFYADPVVVLDFQSLYPSMIIAYNLCFCTCLGNVASSKANILGVSSYSPDPHVLMDLKNQILLSPNGVMYVSSKVRKGVLPRLLEEILSTRIMVKQAMKKLTPSQRVLHRVKISPPFAFVFALLELQILDSRQLALKLIANVTYGYTAAGFSGRMPCAELADSIVQCGRSTLEKAISYVNTRDKWNARVIYGDTDSMFVLLKGRTVAESFKIGREIASAITAMNPNPVTLKMEKVYHPCVLLTKKRYVGYSYENPDQSIPVFDAKGIETVRRDTCAAVAKTLEQSLRTLFEHQEISYVKEYLQRQWTRILCGRVSIQDFVFAKEVRLGTYRASSLPPAALVATKAMKADPRAEPRYGERIPYVVVHGEPGARLVDMVVNPLDLLELNSPYRLNDLYYINKQIIPALQRVFGLIGANLNKWFAEMPRPVRPSLGKRNFYEPKSESLQDFDDSSHGISRKASTSRTRIDYYYLSQHCTLCGELVQASAYLCDNCFKKRPVVAAAIVSKTSKLEREIQHLCSICRQCGGGDWIVERGVKCTSLACAIFYERRKVQKELRSLSSVATETGFYPRCQVEWF